MKDEKTKTQKTDAGIAFDAKDSKFITTAEKAQYEVFKNGNLSRETIDRWIRNDLEAIMSFVHGCLRDESIFKAVSDAYYNRYQQLHKTDNGNDQSELPKP